MTNLEIAMQYVTRLIATDFEGGLELTRDDADFQAPNGKVLTKEQMREVFRDMKPRFTGPGTMKLIGTTCEGNRVAIESIGETPLHNGNVYRNHYHYLFELDDGQIIRVGSYCDPQAMAVVYA